MGEGGTGDRKVDIEAKPQQNTLSTPQHSTKNKGSPLAGVTANQVVRHEHRLASQDQLLDNAAELTPHSG